MANPQTTTYYWFEGDKICSGPVPPAHTKPAETPKIDWAAARRWRDKYVCTRKD